MSLFSPHTEAQLLADLQAAVRSGGDRGLTTAQDLRTFLAGLVAELVGRTDALAAGGATTPTGAGGGVLAAPNGLPYRLAVTNEGALRAVPADGQPAPAAGDILTAPNGLTYRLTVADDGRVSTLPAPGLLDADATAFSTAAGLANVAQQQAVNDLVRALKQANVWPRLRACYPMVGGTAQAHALNLKDPRDLDEAFRLTFYNDPRHTERGVEWDGRGQHADSHFGPAALPANSNHLAYYATTDNNASAQVEIGCGPDNGYFCLLARYNQGNVLAYQSFPQASTAPVATGLGFSLGSRTDSSTTAVYRDGVPITTSIVNDSNAYPHQSVLLAGRPDGYYSQKACGLASIGEGLTATEAAAYAAAVAAFQRALGRAVALDADAAAFSVAAGLQDDRQVLALDQLVKSLKASGVWDNLHLCYPMVGGTARAHALNLKDPRDLDAAFRLTFYNNPTHAAQGVAWDGHSQYADSHYYPSQHLPPQAHHLAYYAATDPNPGGGTEIEIGCLDFTSRISLSMLTRFRDVGGGSYFESGSGGGIRSAYQPSALGFSLDCRASDTSVALYRNGQLLPPFDGTPPTPSTTSPVAPVLLAWRPDGGGSFFSTKTCAFASVGAALTPAQVAAYSAAVAAFQQALGRAVV